MSFLLARICAIVLAQFCLLARAATFDPLLPPSYPLAVRNPYLSAWLPGSDATDLPSAVAQFWNGQLLRWSVLARVDGETYSLFGVPQPGDEIKPAVLISAEFTTTHTTFTLDASNVRVVLDFLSPISPNDYARQSMPFSYLTVMATPLDNKKPKVQIYSDMDNSWIGQFGTDVQLYWSWEAAAKGTQIFTVAPGNAATYSEAGDMALWGTSVYCTRENASKLSSKVGYTDEVRAAFAANASYTDEWDFKPGGVFAYSHNLITLEGPANVTFVIGNVRDKAVSYLGSDRSDYWRGTCNTISCSCNKALDDFKAADAESRALDAMIAGRGAVVAGHNYSDILALSARQAFASMELTIPADSLDTNDVLAFVKEISSDGNINTIDVIMPMAPILYVLSPEYIRLLLHPVMHYLTSGTWPYRYAIHDIGSLYPNVTGHDDGRTEPMPVEECGNLLALVYMYEIATGDKAWKQQFIGLFQQYADYLVERGLYPSNQLSTDDGAGSKANQTGLSIKSAIALNAFGVMTGQQEYCDTGLRFAKAIYDDKDGTDDARTHFTLIQGDDKSWSLQYNLYLDVLLNLNTFPAEAYAMETDFYPSVRREAGIPLDSTENWGKTDWMIFAAATAMAPGVDNDGARDMFVDDVHAFLQNGVNDVPFSDKFFIETSGKDMVGKFDGYKARPVVGGHFALLALKGPGQFPAASAQEVRREETGETPTGEPVASRSGSYGM